MTTVAGGAGSTPSLAIEDRLTPQKVALASMFVGDRTSVAWRVKADARRAARALHEAMVDADARTSEVDLAGQPPIAVHVRPYDHESLTADAADQTVDRTDDNEALRTQVSQGVRWGVIASIATQVGRFAFVAALMRMLGPENFGIVGQATVYITITYIFLHLGTAATIIQRPQLDKAEVGSAWWVNVVLGSALAGLTVVTAPVLAGFFRTEQLTAVLRVLAIFFVLKGMG